MVAKDSRFEIITLSIVLAFCSIVYELLLSNTLALVTGNYVFWQAMTIGVYVGGLGVGSFKSEKLVDTYRSLMRAELWLSFFGAISVVFVYLFHTLLKYFDTLIFFTNGNFSSSAYASNMIVAKVMFFLIIQSLVFLIGYFSGFEIPLLMRMRALQTDVNEKEEHFILGISYLGTLLGTLAFAYILLPKFDVIKTSVFVSSLNLIVCIYFAYRYNRSQVQKNFVFSGLIFIIIFSVFMNERIITQRFLKFFYYNQELFSKINVDLKDSLKKIDRLQDIERIKSDYQYIDFLKVYYKTDIPDDNPFMMALDTKFQFATNTELYYHQAFAHIPFILNGSVAKNVLVLGGGDGFLVRELLKHPEIENIRIIELDNKVVEFAKTRYADRNKNSLSDPRVHLEINDAFYILRNSKLNYDAIFIDFPYPNNFDLAKLYSVEFYKYVYNALSDNGFVVFDAPLHKKNELKKDEDPLSLVNYFNETHYEANSILQSTVYYAGFKATFPYSINRESFMFMKKAPSSINLENLDKFDESKLLPDVVKEIKVLKDYNFPYEIHKRFVNSLFMPTIFKGDDL